MTGGAPLPYRQYGPGDVAEMRRRAAELRAKMFAPVRPAVAKADPIKVVEARPYVVPAPDRAATRAAYAKAAAKLRAHDHGMVAIVRTVSAITGVMARDIKGRSHKSAHIRARFIACYLGHAAGYSYPAVGAHMGGKHHTTVMGGAKRAAAAIVEHSIQVTSDPVEMAQRLWDAP